MASSTWSLPPADELASLQRLSPTSTVAVFCVDTAHSLLVMNQVLGPAATRLSGLTIDIGYHVSGWVASNWVPMVNADAQLDLDIRAEDLRYALSMPLIADHRLMGVLTLYSAHPFGDVLLQQIEMVMPALAANLCDAGEAPTVAPHAIHSAACRH